MVIEGVEEGEVGLRRSFVEPLLPVGPSPGPAAVGEVGVEDKGEGA
ncbi:MAG: hypothetical protein ACE5MB_09975 [Anaerolineae bacterium]